MALSRFLVAGAINTSITYIIYIALLQMMTYVAAYSVTYLIGIALGYILNVYMVFEKSPTVKSAAIYPLVYLLNYVLGLMSVYVMVELIGVNHAIAPLLVVIITSPIMYLVTKLIFKGLEYEKTINQ